MSLRLSARLRSASFRNTAPVFAALGDEARWSLELIVAQWDHAVGSLERAVEGEVTRKR